MPGRSFWFGFLKELFERQHQTPAKLLMQVLHTTALLAALCAIAAPAHARQLMDGLEGIKAYGIEYNNKTIGTVVVVGRDNPNPPPGYIAGREYWTWLPGGAWRGTFTLVPGDTVPDYYSSNWQTFSHDHFDLSRTVPMPSISPEAEDRFYRVQVQSGSRWIDLGWMWLINDERKQEWYGRNLTSDLVGDGTAIRFTSADPPKPGSTDVYLLIH